MTLSTILAPGNTAAPTTDIVLAKDDVVSISVFAVGTPLALPPGVAFTVKFGTMGTDVGIDSLDNFKPATQLFGPGTFRVSRPLYVGQAAGVCIEDGVVI